VELWRQGEAGQLTRALLTLLLTAAIVSNLDLYAHAQQQVRALSADLTFNFDCRSDSSPELDESLERFLKEIGFKVLNVPRLRRERGMTSEPLNSSMQAVDQGQRMILIFSIGLAPGRYAFQLYSPPPTRRAENMEEQILTFVSDTLGCRIRQVVRKEAGLETRDAYKEFLEHVRTRIREGNGGL
jgi:hypothetical protein